MKNMTLPRLALMLPVIIGFTINAKATPVPTLTITEVSSTTLTYSWNGPNDAGSGTATETSPDHWTFTIYDDVVTGLGGTQNVNVNWKEPDYATSGLVNYVNFYQVSVANGTTITVVSDNRPDTAGQGYPLIDNGGSYNFNPISGANLSFFTDNGDDPGVPDGGVTAGLLGLALVSLAALRRKRIF